MSVLWKWLIAALASLVVIAGGAVIYVTTFGTTPTAAPTPAPLSPVTSVSVEPTPSPSVDTRPRAPLTGKLVKNPAALNHVAVAVKISDILPAQPQINLDQADIVFVEPNGIAYTRLAAVFHTTLPDRTGPVRSIRPADVPLLSPMKLAFGSTMAADWVLNYVDSFPSMDNLGTLRVRGKGAYSIDGSRVRIVNGQRQLEHAVVANPKVLAGLSKFKKAPQPYFSYGLTDTEVTALAVGKPASRISVPYGSTPTSFTMSYRYDRASGRYLRWNHWGRHRLASGKQVSATNVLVIRCSWKMDKIFAGGGAKDPVLKLIRGKGTFYAATGGKVVRGTWTKGEVGDLFQFTTNDGQPLKLAPGNTWVELPQIDAKVTVS